MKFYQAEMELMDFAKGWHTLKEWASYGINSVEWQYNRFYDGLLGGCEDVPVLHLDTLFELDYWDFDEDGYRIAIIKEAKEN